MPTFLCACDGIQRKNSFFFFALIIIFLCTLIRFNWYSPKCNRLHIDGISMHLSWPHTAQLFGCSRWKYFPIFPLVFWLVQLARVCAPLCVCLDEFRCQTIYSMKTIEECSCHCLIFHGFFFIWHPIHLSSNKMIAHAIQFNVCACNGMGLNACLLPSVWKAFCTVKGKKRREEARTHKQASISI